MNDSLGSVFVLQIIISFIVIALGYMAFNVNYTKAFRMKNKVISIYEDYDGKCLADCETEIQTYANKIGYTLGDMNCPNDYTSHNNLYCIKSQDVKSNDEHLKDKSSVYHIKKEGSSSHDLSDVKQQQYYSIITKINVDVPIINHALDLQFFEIKGDTKAFNIY